MAFEKMTERELFDKFWAKFGLTLGPVPIRTSNKIGARMLRIELETNLVLYFLYYDETNWNLGTKPFRNRPVKQMERQLRNKNTFNDLNDKLKKVPDVLLEDAVLQMKIAAAKGLHEGFSELITNGNDVITGCNQSWKNIERTAEDMANEPLKPIDWVKEDPDVPEECVHVFCPNSEPVLAHDIPDPNSNDPQNYIFGQ